jgi:hypothetical protein
MHLPVQQVGGGGGLFRATLASLSKGAKNNSVNFLSKKIFVNFLRKFSEQFFLP